MRNTKLSLKLITQLFQPEIKTTGKNNNNRKSSEAYSERTQRSKIEPF